MSNFFKGLGILVAVVFMLNVSECFIPAKIMSKALMKINNALHLDFGNVSRTFPHEVILKRGLLRSIVKYFYDQETKENRARRGIDLKKVDKDYLELKHIYYDHYGISVCDLGLFSAREAIEELQINVEVVDFDESTKDMPYAHFDAETFAESNQRVIEFQQQIYKFLEDKDYETARVLSGQILHTIQDFYSHSNWVEMGHTHINKEIGNKDFSSVPIIDKKTKSVCINNCTVTIVECNAFVTTFIAMMELVGMGGTIKCPLKYYKCAGNIKTLDKLVSGYYSGQKLDDGTEVNKPLHLDKCSHGGILDKTQIVPSEGSFFNCMFCSESSGPP